MVSKLRFARINFEPKLTHFKEERKVKIKRERDEFLKVISFDIDVNSILRKAREKWKSTPRINKPGYQPQKIESIKDDTEWKFGGIKYGDDYIFGKLAKYKGHIITITDEKNKDFKQDKIKDAHLCNFLINFEKHILVYESKKNIGEISPKILIEELFNSYFGGEEQISLEIITDKREIIQRIEDLEVITSVKLHLKPTNPNSSPSSDRMDKLLKSLKASRLTIEASSVAGIDLSGGENFLQSGLRLAEEGYGNAQVIGRKKDKEDEYETINSYNLPVSEKVKLPQDDNDKIALLNKKADEIDDLFKKP